MKRMFRLTLRSLLVVGLFAAAAVTGAFGWARYGPPPLTVRSGAFPEEMVYVRSADDIVNAGMIFAPAKRTGEAGRHHLVTWLGRKTLFADLRHDRPRPGRTRPDDHHREHPDARSRYGGGTTVWQADSRWRDIGASQVKGVSISQPGSDFAEGARLRARRARGSQCRLVGGGRLRDFSGTTPESPAWCWPLEPFKCSGRSADAALLAEATRLVVGGQRRGADSSSQPIVSVVHQRGDVSRSCECAPLRFSIFLDLNFRPPALRPYGSRSWRFSARVRVMWRAGGPRDRPHLRGEICGRLHDSRNRHDRQSRSHVHGRRGAGRRRDLRVGRPTCGWIWNEEQHQAAG